MYSSPTGFFVIMVIFSKCQNIVKLHANIWKRFGKKGRRLIAASCGACSLSTSCAWRWWLLYSWRVCPKRVYEKNSWQSKAIAFSFVRKSGARSLRSDPDFLSWRYTGFSVYMETRIDYKKSDEESDKKLRQLIHYIRYPGAPKAGSPDIEQVSLRKQTCATPNRRLHLNI